MSFIYDLDNEGGGFIIGDLGTDGPALTISNYGTGGGIVLMSCVSGAPLTIPASGFATTLRTTAATTAALIVGRTVVGSPTIAPLKVQHPSTPSAAVIEFGGGFISCTSIDIITAANADYVIPVSLNGNIRYIPLMNSTSIKGGAAVS